jgi:ferrous iron transport protein B
VAAPRLLLVGLPNTGKSSLFNALTGGHALVANYPLTTLDIVRGSASLPGGEREIVDTPGIHGLYVQSEEDAVVRREIFASPAAVLVECMEAHGIVQSLALHADLAGLGLPLVVFLTATREAADRGIRIDTAALERLLGVQVVESPEPGQSVHELKAAVRSARPPARLPDAPAGIEAAVGRIAALLPASFPHGRKAAEILLQEDGRMAAEIAAADPGGDPAGLAAAVAAETARFHERFSRTLARSRDRWVAAIAREAVSRVEVRGRGFAADFGRLARHPAWGVVILGAFLAVTYFSVVHAAGWIAGLLNAWIGDPAAAAVGRLLPAGFWSDLVVGPYGILTLGLFNAVFTVLPILSVFFVVFSLAEDVGYLPNLTVLSRRLFEKIGLTGSSIIPVVLGFGCKTMATLTARNLRSRKERLIVAFLVAFAIPCSAQLGLDMAVLGFFGPLAFLAAVVFLAAVEVAAGLALNAIIPDDQASDYLQELPPIRVPRPRAVLAKVGRRLWSFLLEALPVFLIAAVALFAADRLGALGWLKRVLQPVVTGFLGLPLDTVDAIILSMARHEVAAGLLLRMAGSGALSAGQAVVAVSITTMFVPCIANIVAMVRLLGARAALLEVLAINVSAFLLAGGLHWLLVLVAGGW